MGNILERVYENMEAPPRIKNIAPSNFDQRLAWSLQNGGKGLRLKLMCDGLSLHRNGFSIFLQMGISDLVDARELADTRARNVFFPHF